MKTGRYKYTEGSRGSLVEYITIFYHTNRGYYGVWEWHGTLRTYVMSHFWMKEKRKYFKYEC